MFDLICIFTKGGVVVWSKFFHTVSIELVNVLIKNVLMEEKTAMNQFLYQNYIFKWRMENQSGLVFAVVYQEVLQLIYVDEFIEMLKDDYMEKAYKKIEFRDGFLATLPEYDNNGSKVMQRWQAMISSNDRMSQMKSFGTTSKGQKIVEDQRKRENTEKKMSAKKKRKAEEREKAEAEKREEDERKERERKKQEEAERKAQEWEKEVTEFRGKPSKQGKKEKNSDGDKTAASPKKNVKEIREWGVTKKVTKKDMDSLDYSKKFNKAAKSMLVKPMDVDYFGDEKEGMERFKSDNEAESSEDDKEEEKSGSPKKQGLFSKLTSSIQSLTGNKTMSEEDLIPIFKDFRDSLVKKNVASEIADKVCESVKTSLLSQKTASFTSVKTTVKEALRNSIQRVLTPKVTIDILKEAQSSKARGVPYTIVFIGVNGVGKSTSLAKVAQYLKTKGGLKILIAACDNFRAGAVEQLQVHGKRLDIDVFQKGYGDDAAQICREAVHKAKIDKYDVVLIDTAGRMQDNEPLMKALAKLINVNNPNVILFVGEALVGNDAIDQLTKFNQSLIDFGISQNPRTIDGIILSKFDTVDEKVGAALSMVYTTGKPIVFVGVGQKYSHLTKLDPSMVVKTLMS